jgi:chitodextrinase
VATDESQVTYEVLDGDDTLVQETLDTSLSLTGLTSGTEYNYSVRARDEGGSYSLFLRNTFTTLNEDENAPIFGDGALVAVDVTEMSALLIWPLATDESDVTYEVLDESGVIAGEVVATSLELSGLLSGTEYLYSVIARDDSGNRSSALEVSFTTTGTGGLNPVFEEGELQAITISENSAELNWPIATAVSVVVYEVSDESGMLSELSDTSYILSDLQASTEYTYSVRAKDEDDRRSDALSVTFTTLNADNTSPVFGEGGVDVSDITVSSAQLLWPVASDESDVRYEISDETNNVILEIAESSTLLASLQADTEYSYSITAVDEAGNRSLPLNVIFRTLVLDEVAPQFPSGEMTVTNITEVSATLAWPIAVDENQVSYVVLGPLEDELTVEANSVDIAGLLPGQNYTYSVVAIDVAGNRSEALTTSFTTDDDTGAPVFGSGFATVTRISGSGALVSWPIASDISPVSYIVADENNEFILTTDQLSTSLVGLYPNAEYTVTVNAVDPYGNASQPLTVSFRTLDIPSSTSVPGDIYLSTTANGVVNGIDYQSQDILKFNLFSYEWNILFDGSDMGLTRDIDALAVLPDGDLLLSFDAPTTIESVGAVDDSDIVRFSPDSLGETTAGSFAMHFDGSDVGLTTAGEDVDAIAITENGELLLSISGRFNVNGLIADDEDLIRFVPESLGDTTGGSWILHFDGSDVGLLGEDVWAASYSDDTLYFASQSAATIDGTSMDTDDIASFSIASTGDDTNAALAVPHYFDGDVFSSDSFRIDAVHVVPGDVSDFDGDFNIVQGIDWSLPEAALRADSSGLTWVVDKIEGDGNRLANNLAGNVFGESGDQYQQTRFAVMVQFAWKDVNPAPGVFDWSAIDSLIENILLNATPGVGIFLWPKPYGENIPDWVSEQLGIDFVAVPSNVFRQRDEDLNFLINAPLKQFVEETVSHFSNLNQLVHIDARTSFDAQNGEWSVKDIEPSEEDIELIESWTREYHQFWIDAALATGFPVGKIVTIIAWDHFGGDALLNEAFSAGLGQRDGQPSRRQVWYEAYGSYIDDDGYLVVDESAPAIANSAVRYSELTEFSYSNDNFGPRQLVNERLTAGLLWTLHSRRNWLAVPAQLNNSKQDSPYSSLSAEMKREFDTGVDMMRWAQLQLGHTASTANDAWSWTKSLEYGRYNNNEESGNTIAKNVERWLYQRDIEPDGITVSVIKTRKSDMFRSVTSGIVCDTVWCEDYKARSTQKGVGHDSIYYKLDPSFMNSAQPVEIKVSYYDVVGGEWILEYYGSAGVRQTAQIPISGTGSLRTITFDLEEFVPSGSFESEMDFRIRATGNTDAVIRFVRVIKSSS